MQTLAGRKAFITGASAGIGAAIARSLSAAGAHVVLAARRSDRIQELAGQLEGAQAVALDVRDADAVRAAIEAAQPDLVVAGAGLALGTDSLQDGDPADWSVVLDTNVKGVLHVLRGALPGLIEAEGGDVVLLGSVAGRQVYPGGNVYNASKFAVRALYEAMRLDAGGHGIRFTTVDPGMVESEFSLVRMRGDAGKAESVYKGMQALTPEDVADAVLFAVSRPAHVNIGEIVLWPTDQSSTRDVHRS